jgi:hypothetical protein
MKQKLPDLDKKSKITVTHLEDGEEEKARRLSRTPCLMNDELFVRYN